MLKLHLTPGSCTTGIHILMQELDLLFEVRLVNLPRGDHRSEAFLAINPKGSIPVLELDDGSAITEFQAIAWWLARQHPEAGLLPADPQDEVRVLEVMGYVVGSIHMQGFARIFTSDAFASTEADHQAVKRQGKEIVEQGFVVVDAQLNDRGYVLDAFSIADAALFYVEFWAMHLGMTLPPRCRRHYETMLQRPAVAQILIEEGYGNKVA